MVSQANEHADAIVCRAIPVDLILTRAAIQTYESQLSATLNLNLKPKGSLEVRYNAATIGFDQVIQQLEQSGIRPRNTRWYRIKAAWYRFVDANVAAQVKARPKPCCNRVPKM